VVLLPYPPRSSTWADPVALQGASDLERLWIDYVGELARERRPIPTARPLSSHTHPPVRGRHAGGAVGDAPGTGELQEAQLVWVSDVEAVLKGCGRDVLALARASLGSCRGAA